MAALSSMPEPVRRAVRAVYYPLFQAAIQLRCRWTDLVSPPNTGDFPLPPAMLRFRVSETIPPSEFQRVGRGVASIISARFASAGIVLDPSRAVLDFGCGCGRTLTWLLKDHPGVRFHGTDVDHEAIEWCQAHIPGAQFEVNGASPPLRYADASFDAVYCLSVFTHLDEPSQDLWLQELHRILKPGGLLIFSVHGKNAAAALNPADQAQLAASGFLHRRSQKLSGMVPDWYQTSWHAKEYIVARVNRWFSEVSYSSTPGHLQDLVIARRRT